MRLYLVRHGETDANRVLGHSVSGPAHNEPVVFKEGDDTNISLNVNGRRQAKECVQQLPEKIDKIYSSRLIRAKETAEIILTTKGLDISTVEFRDELAEYRQGSLEGFSSDQKKEKSGPGGWGSGLMCDYDYTPWGGDSWKTIYDRLVSLFAKLKDSGIENAILVTSGGPIRMTYKILLSEKSPGIQKHIMIKNGTVHEFII